VVFEGRFVQALEVRILNSYLTVDLGAWVCRPFGGQHKGTSSEELRRVRPVSEIAFVERRGEGCAGDEKVLVVNEHVIENVPTVKRVEQDCG
jgi:hypothetical protein